MKVDLLGVSGLSVAQIAASTCVSSEIPNSVDPKGLISALRSGHDSLLEHITLSFVIEGISRVCLAQLTRHRHASFSVQSQRYVPMSEKDIDVRRIIPGTSVDDEGHISVDWIQPKMIDPWVKYLDVDLDELNQDCREVARYMKGMGFKGEDIRYIYPQGVLTNLIMTCNFREFAHMCGLRRCARAQKEIRDLFDMMADKVCDRLRATVSSDDLLDELLRRLEPQCIQIGYCPEERTCGAMPRYQELKDAYANRTKED